MVDQFAAPPKTDEDLTGIGGWLLIHAFAFIVVPPAATFFLIVGILHFDDIARRGDAAVLATEITLKALLAGFTVAVGIRFFRKKRNAPALVCLLLFLVAFVELLLYLYKLGAEIILFSDPGKLPMVFSIIQAMVWIPYFNVSRRVRLTFVND